MLANTRETLGDQATFDGLVSKKLTSLEEDRIVALRDRALYYSENLINVKMPNLKKCGTHTFSGAGFTEITADMFPALTDIGSYSFSNCKNLIRAEFPEATTINEYAFSNCTSLQSIKFSSATNKLITYARPFSQCTALSELIILSNTLPTLQNLYFLNTTPIYYKFGTVYVPRSMLDTYKADAKWNSYFIAPYEDYPVLPEGTITDSFAEIIASEENGTYLEKYTIGDTKYVKIGPDIIDFEIIAFDTDDLANGQGKAHITWLAKHLLHNNSYMNETPTTEGGWAQCSMRNKLRDLVAECDGDLKSAIKEVNKTYFDYNAQITKTIADTFWIPSSREVGFGSTPTESSGVVYSELSSNRVKKTFSDNSQIYWLRTAASNKKYKIVTSSGSGGSNPDADQFQYILIGFCT